MPAFLNSLPEGLGVNIAAVREPGAKGIQIGPNQGIGSGEIDVIGNEHQIAGSEAEVHTAASVGQYQDFHTHGPQHPHGHGQFPLRHSFIVMDPALHDHHFLAAVLTEDQCAAMTGSRRQREAGNIPVGDLDGVFQFVRIITQATAKNHADSGPVLYL